MKHNTGEAILFLGCVYLLTIIDGWEKWFLLIPIFLTGYTWSKDYFSEDQKELLKVSLQKLKLEIELMKAQTKFYVIQGAAIMRGLRSK